MSRAFASDGGPEYTSTRMKDLHRRVGTIQRISSVAHPHANERAGETCTSWHSDKPWARAEGAHPETRSPSTVHSI